MEGTSAYRDEHGAPRVRQSIVGFFDILGFSQTSIACSSVEESQSVLNKIAAAIDDSRQYVREYFAADGGESAGKWALKFFSDNLVLCHAIDEKESSAAVEFILRCAQRYQLGMAMTGYFVRGALTQGPICLTEEIIFGSALVESYNLESKASIVPRVVLTEELQRVVLESFERDKNSFSGVQPLICRDVDGWWFVNYLQAAQTPAGIQWDLIRRHKDSVLASLSRTTRHDVLPKFGWACRYHNVFCHWHSNDPGFSEDCRINRTDEQSTIHRLGDDIAAAPA